MKSLGLIGFSGSGKTSLIQLAAKEGFKVADSDVFVEKRHNSIDDLILNGKEALFRTLEYEAILEILDGRFEMVAFGGGFYYGSLAWRDVARRDLKLIYLRNSFDDLILRVKNAPLLRKLGMNSYRNLFNERLPLYEKAADFTIDVKNRALDELWLEVKKIWSYLFQRTI